MSSLPPSISATVGSLITEAARAVVSVISPRPVTCVGRAGSPARSVSVSSIEYECPTSPSYGGSYSPPLPQPPLPEPVRKPRENAKARRVARRLHNLKGIAPRVLGAVTSEVSGLTTVVAAPDATQFAPIVMTGQMASGASLPLNNCCSLSVECKSLSSEVPRARSCPAVPVKLTAGPVMSGRSVSEFASAQPPLVMPVAVSPPVPPVKVVAYSLPEKFYFRCSYWSDGTVAVAAPFIWWNPFTWWRPGVRSYKSAHTVISVPTQNRSVCELNVPSLRDEADLRVVKVVDKAPHWFWWSPAPAVYEYTISGVYYHALMTTFQAGGVPSLARMAEVLRRIKSVNAPRGIVRCRNTNDTKSWYSNRNLSNVGDYTVIFAHDVKSSGRLVFLPGAANVSDMSSMATESPMRSYLNSLPVAMLRSLFTTPVLRVVLQCIVAWVVTMLAQAFLPQMLVVSILRGLGWELGSSAHHQL